MEGPFRSLLILAVLIAGGFGGFAFLQNGGLAWLQNLPAAAGDPANPKTPAAANAGDQVAVRPGETIKIAAFNIQVFGQSKLGKPHVMQILAEIVRRFDVVAIQEIRSKEDDLMPRFVELINSNGRQYDYVVGPRLGRTNSKEQYAFVFDRATIEIDRNALYTIDDPDDLMHREPFVGWFRARGPPPERAFTFSLVNVHTDPDEVAPELKALAAVFKAVRDDGRGEDDVILLGDFNTDSQHLGALGQISGLVSAISGTPTNTARTKEYDNLIFHGQATREFTGRGGVFDTMREFNLTLEAAQEVSDHCPVWAEFRIEEGGQPGAIAARPTETPK